jgi:hypothetical protein
MKKSRSHSTMKPITAGAALRPAENRLASDADRIERLKQQERGLREQVIDFRAADRLSRDAVHDRPNR